VRYITPVNTTFGVTPGKKLWAAIDGAKLTGKCTTDQLQVRYQLDADSSLLLWMSARWRLRSSIEGGENVLSAPEAGQLWSAQLLPRSTASFDILVAFLIRIPYGQWRKKYSRASNSYLQKSWTSITNSRGHIRRTQEPIIRSIFVHCTYDRSRSEPL
jgi:hypothetical protein